MSTYLVHGPATATHLIETADRVRISRDGFSWAAFLVTPIWLLAERHWLMSIGWFLLVASLTISVFFGWLASATALTIYALSALLVGLEAGPLRARKLTRQSLEVRDLVTSRNADHAARAYFAGLAETIQKGDLRS